MRAARIIVASALAIGASASVAQAQQTGEGTVTIVNRVNGTISIQQSQDGTVGANVPVAEVFKVQDGSMLEPVHAGDRVAFSVSESGGNKTITKLQRKKD